MKISLMPKFLMILLLVVASIHLVPAQRACGDPNVNTLLKVVNNPHNLSNWSNANAPGNIKADTNNNGGTDQICIFCHTPHSAASAAGPLWARPDPSGTFVLYGGSLAIKDSFGGGGIKATAKYYTTGEAGAPVGHVYPNGASRLCMSCHDGVTAIGLLRDFTSIAMTGSLDGDGSLQDSLASVINLSTSHPISFVYTDAVAAQVEGAYDSQYGSSLYFQGPASFDNNVRVPLDAESRMQCTTCHDPHYANHLVTSVPPFWGNLYATGYGSVYDAVCVQCHVGGTPGSSSGDHFPGPGMTYP